MSRGLPQWLNQAAKGNLRWIFERPGVGKLWPTGQIRPTTRFWNNHRNIDTSMPLCTASGGFDTTVAELSSCAETLSPISIKHLLYCPLQQSWLIPAPGLGSGKGVKGERGWPSTFWNSIWISALVFPNALFTFRFRALNRGRKSTPYVCSGPPEEKMPRQH